MLLDRMHKMVSLRGKGEEGERMKGEGKDGKIDDG